MSHWAKELLRGFLTQELGMATKQDLDDAIAAEKKRADDAVARVAKHEAANAAATTTLDATVDSLNQKISDLQEQVSAGTPPAEIDFSDEVASLEAVGQTLDSVDPEPAQSAPLAPDAPDGTTGGTAGTDSTGSGPAGGFVPGAGA